MSHEPTQQEFKEAAVYTGKKLRIGLVGAGNISNAHLEAYKNVPEAEIVAVCDIDEERLKLTADAYGIKKTYASIEEMIQNEKLDAADICVWNCNHAECTIYALEHGLHVLCEKPMAYNAQQAVEMKQAAEKAGKLLMIGFVLRFSEETELALDFAKNMGDIYYSKAVYLRRHGAPGGWFCDKARSGGGPVIDLGVHVIDQTRLIMGRPKPVSVYAMTSNKLGFRPELKNKVGWSPRKSKFDTDICDVEDFGTALIRYDNGAVTLLETSYSLNGENESRKELYGTKGGLILGDSPKFYTVINDRLADIAPVLSGNQSSDMFTNEMRHFVDCALNGTPCRASAEDGIWVMKILDAIYESAATGHEVIL